MATGTSRRKDKKITILKVSYIQNEFGGYEEVEEPLPGGENIRAYLSLGEMFPEAFFPGAVRPCACRLLARSRSTASQTFAALS